MTLVNFRFSDRHRDLATRDLSRSTIKQRVGQAREAARLKLPGSSVVAASTTVSGHDRSSGRAAGDRSLTVRRRISGPDQAGVNR
jgi:hypothetical protein